MMGLPLYSVWQQGLAGQAALKRAEQDRKIQIEEAKALKESASYKNEAEIIRAGGVAEANKIIGNSLQGKEEYLRYLFIDMLRDTGGEGRETIYLPTEAGIPILEAKRLTE
jgi:regulator of protease activity HflC (stomatin/prohibitin superfamily)